MIKTVSLQAAEMEKDAAQKKTKARKVPEERQPTIQMDQDEETEQNPVRVVTPGQIRKEMKEAQERKRNQGRSQKQQQKQNMKTNRNP